MFGVYPFGNNTVYVNDAIVSGIVGLVVAFAVCALAIGGALFVFWAFSLYKIARRRGIRNAWLAWVPVCSDWILGSVADQYQYVAKGRNKNRRLPLFLVHVTMMGLRIVTSALSVAVMTAIVRLVLAGVGGPETGSMVCLAVTSVGYSVAAIAYLVIRCCAVYDLYTSCTSRNNVLFLILGLVFPVLEPIFFFVCRNGEEGMPPRREEPVSCQVEEQPEDDEEIL